MKNRKQHLGELNRICREFERVRCKIEEEQLAEELVELAKTLGLTPKSLPWSGHARDLSKRLGAGSTPTTAGFKASAFCRLFPKYVTSTRTATGARYFFACPPDNFLESYQNPKI